MDMVEDRQTINIIEQQMQKLKYPNPMSLEYLLNHPLEEETTYVPTEEEIAESLLQSMNVVQDEEEEDESEEIPIITVKSAVESIEKVGLFLMQQSTN
ncbi:hypothetical protein FRX31_028967 [Thalictrum thalictroides]|uniref:Uncharacterized protein n=1 Tax=Thalictrum thalictroides TaxID=46969 RepID=A0A7J6V8S3_THATH|nr:hypothetical protein FRX31_028967 [Thalictrum thalictroides]